MEDGRMTARKLFSDEDMGKDTHDDIMAWMEKLQTEKVHKSSKSWGIDFTRDPKEGVYAVPRQGASSFPPASAGGLPLPDPRFFSS